MNVDGRLHLRINKDFEEQLYKIIKEVPGITTKTAAIRYAVEETIKLISSKSIKSNGAAEKDKKKDLYFLKE